MNVNVKTIYVMDGKEVSENWLINNLKSVLKCKILEITTYICSEEFNFKVLKFVLNTEDKKLEYIANYYNKFFFIREGIKHEFVNIFNCSLNRLEKYLIMTNNKKWLLNHYYKMGRTQETIKHLSEKNKEIIKIKNNAGKDYCIEEDDDPRTWNFYT